MRRARSTLAPLFMALATAASTARDARAQIDTTVHHGPLFTYRDAILAGTFGVATLLARPFDDHYAQRLQDSSTQANRKLHNLAKFVRTTATPGSYIIGGTMWATGRIFGNDKLAQLGLHGTEALVIGEVSAGVIKGVVGRQRPSVRPRNSNSYELFRGFKSDDNYRSFPSGHTTSAFAAAAAVTSETSGWWPDSRWVIGPILYTGAALAGVSRMYDNRHWASDVLVGAGVGTFAGLKVVRFIHSHPDNRVDHWLLAGSLSPAPDGGHTLHWSLMRAPNPIDAPAATPRRQSTAH